MFYSSFPPVKKTVYCALLTALAAVLGGLLSFPVTLFGAYAAKISFFVVPVFLAGIFFGPAWGGMAGALADLIQALAFPKGPYLPWMSLSYALFGAIPGLFFLKQAKVRLLRLLSAVFTTQAITSVGVNTLILVLVNGYPWEIIYGRMVTQAVMIPVYTFVCFALIQALQRAGVMPKTA